MKVMPSLVLAAGLALATPALADEVEDSVTEALQAYHEQDYAAAKQALDYASQLLSQKNAARLSDILPAPLPGWEIKGDESEAIGMGVFGGGIQASRTFHRDGKTVEIQIVGDSPLLAQWIPMISNPAIAAATGAKRLRIGKEYALSTKDGQIILVVDNRFLITIGGTASTESKTAFGQAIDFPALAAL